MDDEGDATSCDEVADGDAVLRAGNAFGLGLLIEARSEARQVGDPAAQVCRRAADNRAEAQAGDLYRVVAAMIADIALAARATHDEAALGNVDVDPCIGVRVGLRYRESACDEAACEGNGGCE